MADTNLVQMLRNAGVEAWNRSRVNHPDYPRCDIYEEAIWGADLSKAELSGADLRSAILLGRTSVAPIFGPPTYPMRGFIRPT